MMIYEHLHCTLPDGTAGRLQRAGWLKYSLELPRNAKIEEIRIREGRPDFTLIFRSEEGHETNEPVTILLVAADQQMQSLPVVYLGSDTYRRITYLLPLNSTTWVAEKLKHIEEV